MIKLIVLCLFFHEYLCTAAPSSAVASSPLDSLTAEQRAKLNAVLCTGKAALSFDKIGSKEINAKELNILLKMSGMEDLTDTLLLKLDADGSNSLNFDELMAVVDNRQLG